MKVSKEILDLVPYKPGKPISEAKREYGLSHIVKLASNENPLGISDVVKSAISKALLDVAKYPDPTAYELREAVSQSWSIPMDCIGVGNGSNEIIDLLIRIFCEPGDEIITTEHAFLAYQICAQAARVRTQFIPTKQGYITDLDRMSEYLRLEPKSAPVRIVFLPNPNNPTGTYISKDEVIRFLNRYGNFPDLLIVFDEAYTEFVRANDYESAIHYVQKYKNVAVIRTLSKAYGLAGLRVGFLLAQPEIVDLFNRVRIPFNVNNLAQVGAVAALSDSDFVRKTVELTWRGLDWTYERLRELNLPYLDSQANFVLFDTKKDSKVINEELLKRGLILRPVSNYGFKTHLRMSMGLMEENEFALRTLTQVLRQLEQ